jgi:hypothetical protein
MVTDIARLLPPNSTDLEKRLCAAFDRDGLGLLADTFRRLKTEPQAAILPWLAAEWQLSGFVKYHPDLPSLIEEGLPWLMERGTAAAVERVLSWLDMTLKTLEEDASRLSFDPGRVILHEELPDVVYLILQSIPAHVDLYRIFHGYDIRPIGLSGPEALDEGFLSDDSGIWVEVDGEWVKLSFGQNHAVWINGAHGHVVRTARGDAGYSRIWYEDRARLSIWALDSEIVPNWKVVVGMLFAHEYRGVDAHPPSLGRRIDVARMSIDLDEDRDGFGDINHGFAGAWDIEMRPFVLSDSALSDHDNDLRHIYVDEQFIDDRPLSYAPPLSPARASPTARRDRHQFRASRGSGSGWTGKWDTRKWYANAIRIPSNITHTEQE